MSGLSGLARVGGFGVGLAAIFTVALAAGSLWGPRAAPTGAHGEGPGHGGQMSHDDEHGRPGAATPVEHLPGGLQRSQAGYTLDLDEATLGAGPEVPVAFRVTGPDGRPVTTYDVEHGKRLHLIVVRRDLTGFQHVHPALDEATGRWTAPVALAPGSWRVFADFAATGGPALTLGTDLTVPGEVPAPDPVAAERRTDEVDGYTVELAGELVAGSGSEVVLSISRAGAPVTDLQPYLGAYGHLVALREGDLAYLHVHPHDSGSAGPRIAFTAEVPSAGRYRLFLDFRHAGAVRTASFDVTALRP